MKRRIQILASAVRNLWVLACVADGIDPSSKFVVFSKGNRFTERLNQATQQLQGERLFAAGRSVTVPT